LFDLDVGVGVAVRRCVKGMNGASLALMLALSKSVGWM
jgi:hypothetical protein